MKTLLVKQVAEDGRTRTWRLRPEGSPVTLGSSRRARLTSLDHEAAGIEGVFEFRSEGWAFVTLKDCKDVDPVQMLKDDSVLKVGKTKLHISLHERDKSMYQRLEKRSDANADYEFEIGRMAGEVLFTRVVKKGSVESVEVQNMRKIMGEELSIQRSPVKLESSKKYLKVDIRKSMDKESRLGVALIAVCALAFSLLAVYGPHSSEEVTNVMAIPPQMAEMMFKPSLPHKASAPKQHESPVQQQAKSNDNDAPKGGKIASLLKGLSGGRLSKLMGKVSSQEARSREVVVQNGIKANEGPSAVAVSSFGNDKSKAEWAKAAQGGNVAVSTAGHGTGRGIAGMGTLSAGAVGRGGVGLIEEESDVVGGLDREIIAQTIKTYLGQILYCYERQLSAHPDLFGKVAVHFTIGPNGGVESEKIGDTTLRNATVEGCILNKVASWKFPTPQGGTRVMVTYPFLFKSTN